MKLLRKFSTFVVEVMLVKILFELVAGIILAIIIWLASQKE